MSKEKPEVGDVWEDKISSVKRVVLNASPSYVTTAVRACDDLFYASDWEMSGFLNHNTYLGKSKVSIKELFDVKD